MRFFSARVFVLSFLLSLCVGLFAPTYIYAQTTASQNSYDAPDTDPNVPVNQNTRVQSLMIDLLSSGVCVLTGINPINNGPCLDVNPLTHKIGYNPDSYDKNGNVQPGGLLGMSGDLLAVMYTPAISTSEYTNYLSENFGIAKPAYADTAITSNGYGFAALQPILNLWIAIRNLAYFMLMLAFLIIGLGIMVRFKIDPRTVMTFQNQIPRIIICIILITFSYSIAALMIDSMWLGTYVGINIITKAAPTQDNAVSTDPTVNSNTKLSAAATKSLMDTPFGFVSNTTGIINIQNKVSSSVGGMLSHLIATALGSDNSSCFSGKIFGIIPKPSIRGCLSEIIGFFAHWLFWIIMFTILLKSLISVWLTLIKAYVMVIVYTIGAPFFIVMGLLPGRPLGFEKWMRSMFANLAVFPLTVFLLILARLFMDIFSSNTNANFTPPLIGQPNITGFLGSIIAFGMILMAPTLLSTLQESLKATTNKRSSAIMGGIAAGAAPFTKATGAVWKRAMQRETDHQNAGAARQFFAGSGPTGDAKIQAANFKIRKPSTWAKGAIPRIQRARKSFFMPEKKPQKP